MDEQPVKKRFSTVQVMEATAAAVLAAAVIGTAGGMGWLILALPDKLQELETRITQIIQNQGTFREEFAGVKKQVNELDRRVIRLEIK
jgi:hypothetical protein